MRKIASNYILLPGFPLVKNGYVVWDSRGVVDVVDTGGIIKEIPGLEFYGGLIVADYGKNMENRLKTGVDILSVLNEIYREKGTDYQSLALIEGADWSNFQFLDNTIFRILR